MSELRKVWNCLIFVPLGLWLLVMLALFGDPEGD